MAFGSVKRRADRRAATLDAPLPRYKPKPENVPVDDKTPPVGTSREVLAWVGTDKVRAKAALTRELRSTAARVSLLDTLHKMLQQA